MYNLYSASTTKKKKKKKTLTVYIVFEQGCVKICRLHSSQGAYWFLHVYILNLLFKHNYLGHVYDVVLL